MKKYKNWIPIKVQETEPREEVEKIIPPKELKLKTKPGIFSKDGIDKGTKLLLSKVEKPVDRELICDLGCGGGVIGLTLAMLNPRVHVHLLDSDIRAVELAKENAEFNKLRNVEVFLSDLFKAVETRTYQKIYSNPPQSMGNEFLEETIKESLKHLKESGDLVWVVKSNLKNVVERLFEKYFKNSKLVTSGGGYVVLKARKEIN